MPTTNEASNHPMRSRKRSADGLSRRKRAPVACQFCRLRKTRCDGVRPVCGFCQHHDAQCVWGPTTDSVEGTPIEQSILQQLGEIKDMFRDTRAPSMQEIASPPSATASHMATSSSSAATTNPFAHTRCESVLAWPIFSGVVNSEDANVESFVLECEKLEPFEDAEALHRSTMATSPHRAGMGIPEERVVVLCHKFLVHVHARNPILDANHLIQYARRVAEHGAQWDSPSCLVVCQSIIISICFD